MGEPAGCRHPRREHGVCTTCGDCVHEVVLNGACYHCGRTDIAVTIKAAAPAKIVPRERLVARVREGGAARAGAPAREGEGGRGGGDER